MRKTAIFFLILLLPFRIPLVNSAPDEGYGEANENLGQFTDTFVNETYVAVLQNVIVNITLECTELNYMTGIPVYEDFTIYTELDPNARVTVNSATLFTWVGLRRGDGLTYVDEDYGAGNFGQDFRFTFLLGVTAIEAGDVSDADFIYILSFGNNNHNPLTDPRITILIQQNGASDTDYYLYFRIDDVHAGWDFDLSSLLDVGTVYYIELDRDSGDDLTLEIRTVSFSGPIEDTLVVNLNNFDDNFRYISALHKRNYGTDVNDWISGTMEFLWNQTGVSGYVDEGYFLTEDYLNETQGNSLTLLTNASLPPSTGITVQFSSDNTTWVDNHGNIGSSTVRANFSALDLRDLNYSDIFMRYNLSGPGGEVTSRLYQSRIVTTNGTVGGAPGPGVTVIESDAPWIALAIILSIIAFLLATRIKR